MKKLIAFLFLVLLLVLFVGVVLFFRGAPELTPQPLKPVLSWVDDAQTELAEKTALWRRQYLNEPEPIVASDSVTAPETLARVTLSDNQISRVTVDERGQVAVETRASEAAPAETATRAEPASAAVSSPAPAPGSASVAVAAATPQPNAVETSATSDTSNAVTPALTPPLGESSSAELAAIAKADAAIAAADAALARAQGLPVPASAQTPRPIEASAPDSVNAEQVTNKIKAQAAPELALPTSIAAQARSREPAVPRAGDTASPSQSNRPDTTGGSALGGASVVLAQAATQIPAQSVMPTQPTVLAAIPAPTILPPDSPAPAPAASPAGREQQAIIKNFLAGKSVAFETGRDVLTPQGRRALQALLGIIERNRDSVITIQGHTDSIGDERSNLELSTSRAIATRAYLIRRGVAPDRLLVQGFGESQPVSSNGTAAGREQNRRIDFAVSDG